MNLVIDIGNYRIKGAFFQEDQLQDPFTIAPEDPRLEEILKKYPIEKVLIASVHEAHQKVVEKVLTSLKIPFSILDFAKVKIKLETKENEKIGHDRLANVYGALYHFPQNDCIVVDLGTAVTFDVIGCNGSYLGGAIYPGIDIGSKALANYTDKLFEAPMEKPIETIGKTTKTHIQCGLYYGLLGAIERITFEMRKNFTSPSTIKVIATGGLITKMPEITEDLRDLVDLIDPMLTLIGIHEILKEM